MWELYVRQRGDANIKSGADMSTKVQAITDPQFVAVTRTRPGGGGGGGGADTMELNMEERMLQRQAFQQLILNCMAELRLDAVVYPTMNVPPLKIQQPEEPAVNNRAG